MLVNSSLLKYVENVALLRRLSCRDEDICSLLLLSLMGRLLTTEKLCN